MAQTVTAPRGTQDIVPPESRRWSELEARIRSLADRFGYAEIRTPAFEATELFVRGVGDATDIVEKEMYTFRDRGDRELTLRPEWTAPVVRAALERRLLDAETRLFYIGPIFRYERPQKGRYRQSHQFGVECFGAAGSEADVEVISMAWELTRAYGLSDVVLNVNSIGDAACRPVYRQALLDHFRPHAGQLSEESRRRLERNPLRVLDSKDPADRPFVETAPAFEGSLCDACRDHFEALKAYLERDRNTVRRQLPYRARPRLLQPYRLRDYIRRVGCAKHRLRRRTVRRAGQGARRTGGTGGRFRTRARTFLADPGRDGPSRGAAAQRGASDCLGTGRALPARSADRTASRNAFPTGLRRLLGSQVARTTQGRRPQRGALRVGGRQQRTRGEATCCYAI